MTSRNAHSPHDDSTCSFGPSHNDAVPFLPREGWPAEHSGPPADTHPSALNPYLYALLDCPSAPAPAPSHPVVCEYQAYAANQRAYNTQSRFRLQIVFCHSCTYCSTGTVCSTELTWSDRSATAQKGSSIGHVHLCMKLSKRLNYHHRECGKQNWGQRQPTAERGEPDVSAINTSLSPAWVCLRYESADAGAHMRSSPGDMRRR